MRDDKFIDEPLHASEVAVGGGVSPHECFLVFLEIATEPVVETPDGRVEVTLKGSLRSAIIVGLPWATAAGLHRALGEQLQAHGQKRIRGD